MRTKIFCAVAILLLCISCQTYTVTVDSFKTQMTTPESGSKQEVAINHPTFYTSSNRDRNLTYMANTVKSIEVIDKKGNKVRLQNSPKLEMRITRKDGKKHILYFDTVIVKNDTLKGARSRIMQNLNRAVALTDIAKIEIQDSKKVYKYQ